ncbi:hypothetical protein OMAG_002960, partial [Candidatus Omnitrophus magneticus]
IYLNIKKFIEAFALAENYNNPDILRIINAKTFKSMERIIKTVFNKEYFPADMQFMILTRDQEINRRKYSKGELVLIDMDNYKTIKSVTIQNTSPQNVFLEAFIEVRIKNLKTILSIKAKE